MSGVKGNRKPERIDEHLVTEDFVGEFKYSRAMKRIIELVYKMKVMKVSHIAETTGYHIRTVRDAVKVLHINRFLYRQFPPSLRSEFGSHEGYVMLDRAGKLYIAGLYDIPLREVKYNPREHVINTNYLEHSYMINETRIEFEKYAREIKTIKIDGVCDKHLYYRFFKGQREFKLRPDMLMRMSTGDKERHFFFEIDRSTEAVMALSSKTVGFNRKIENYEEFMISRAYEDYGLQVFPEVIVIAETRERVMKLLKTIVNLQHVKVYFTTLEMLQNDIIGDIFVTLNAEKQPVSLSLFSERS